jgi:hypothetical protein
VEGWKPEIIEQDFKQLSENRLGFKNYFPVAGFFNIHIVYSGREGSRNILLQDEQPLPLAGSGSDGMSEEQLRHLGNFFTGLAKKPGEVLVGLVTGWMSSQLYVHQLLKKRKRYEDPVSLVWQQNS